MAERKMGDLRHTSFPVDKCPQIMLNICGMGDIPDCGNYFSERRYNVEEKKEPTGKVDRRWMPVRAFRKYFPNEVSSSAAGSV